MNRYPPVYAARFYYRPFDTDRNEVTELVGDYRVRNDSHLGSDRPATRVTTTSYASDEAAKNLADRKEHGLNQRIRVGVDARINDNTNIRVVRQCFWPSWCR